MTNSSILINDSKNVPVSITTEGNQRRALPHSPEAVKSSVVTHKATMRHKSQDNYDAVVVVIDDRTRVIEGSCGVQWVLQKRNSKTTWTGVMFFRSKAGLLLHAPKPIAPELLALPDWFPDRSEMVKA